jgi:hypothetical protein
MSPRKKEGAPARARSTVTLKPPSNGACQHYYLVAVIAKVFERPFWYWEQKRSKLCDQLAKEGVEL